MKVEKETLPDNKDQLKTMLLKLSEKYTEKEKTLSQAEQNLETTTKNLETTTQNLKATTRENEILREKIYLLTAKLYGKSSEKRKINNPDLQYTQYFDIFPLNYQDLDTSEEDKTSTLDNENNSSSTEKEEETIEVKNYKRKKTGRKPLPPELLRKEIIHDIAEKDKICGCGNTLSKIGEEVTEQLEIIPAKMYVNRHIRYKYACKNCEGIETEGGTVKTAAVAPSIIPKSIAGASLLAYVMTSKFIDSLPFYRQEAQFKRLNIELHRNTMSGWVTKLSEKCLPLMNLLKKEILNCERINMDETTVQVMNEEGKSNKTKSYMWVFTGGPPGKRSYLYQYSKTRSGTVAKDFLKNYSGFVQTDGYAGYDFLDSQKDIVHVGCFAHARRKFTEVIQGSGKKGQGKGKKGLANQALDFIRDLYGIEKEIKKIREDSFDIAKIQEIRNQYALPILEDFYKWLIDKKPKVPPKSLLGKAISYTLNQWHRLNKYVDNSYLTPDNNISENAIRPFVVGRKNWLFSGSPEGAAASATMYSLIETAKVNGLNPHKYLLTLFENIPYASTEEDYKKLLPQYIDNNLM